MNSCTFELISIFINSISINCLSAKKYLKVNDIKDKSW